MTEFMVAPTPQGAPSSDSSVLRMSAPHGWFEILSASVTGRGHMALRRNRQDAMASGAREGWVFGVVSDGCGSGRASELGALVTATVMGEELARSASSGRSPEEALRASLEAAVGALGELADRAASRESRPGFVTDHLLATALAFVLTRDGGAILASGDGFAYIDGHVSSFDQENAPRYAGYALGGAEVEPPHIVSFGRARSIAIATDGFDRSSLERALAYEGRFLTRALRIDQRAGAFDDDATIVIARRYPGTGT